MRLAMTALALGHGRVRSVVTEDTGKGLVLGRGLGHQGADILMTRHAETALRFDIGHD